MITIVGPAALLQHVRQLPSLADVDVVYQVDEAAAIEGQARRACDAQTLYADGEIACESARALAVPSAISVAQVGDILQVLRIKIRHCALGCFS